MSRLIYFKIFLNKLKSEHETGLKSNRNECPDHIYPNISVYSSPMVDRSYMPGPCSRLADVVGPPTIGGNGRAGLKTCGNARKKVILEYVYLFFANLAMFGCFSKARLILKCEI